MKHVLLILSAIILVSCGALPSSEDASSHSVFEWDFSKQRKLIYSISQTTTSENVIGAKGLPETKSSISMLGKLNVRVKENNHADISLTDMSTHITSYNAKGEVQHEMDQEVPAVVVQDMGSDGSFSDPTSEMLFHIMFPLPKQNLEEGDSEKVATQMPFNANGSRLYVKGTNTLTFKGYEEVLERNCAVLESEIDVSDLEIPEELVGDYQCTMKGTGTYYFDLEDQIYVGADVEVAIFMKMESTLAMGDEPQTMFMKMNSSNVYKVRLEKIEK